MGRPGLADNPRIVEYHRTTSLRATDDEVPWCSAFVNWCMREAGLRGTGSAAARSWLTWGSRLATPRRGCVTVLRRGTNPAGKQRPERRTLDRLLGALDFPVSALEDTIALSCASAVPPSSRSH
ncbi:MAG TPA: TIGR02594 family protein [Thermoanaerobaculia bacterium]|nr:TIGR02594 family protein [Thermoanaerobaculia bacterium]